jgi:hypothetical protein
MGRSKKKMRKVKLTTVTAQNLINENEIGFAYAVEKLTERGNNAVEIANMLAAAVNNCIIKEASKEEHKPARQGFAPDFNFLIKLSLNFLDAMTSKRLTYSVKHVSKSGWTHYISCNDNSWGDNWMNVFLHFYCSQSRCKRAGELCGFIRQVGCGYDKIHDLHQHALSMLRTLNLIESGSHFDRMYTVK